MSKPSADEICTKVDRVEKNEPALYDRIVRHYKLWRGEAYTPDDGYQAYTDNVPQIQAEKTIALMSSAKMDLRIPVDIHKKKRRLDMSQTERFMLGFLDAEDARRASIGQPPLQSEMAWHAYVTGFIVLVPLIFKATDGTTQLQCPLWHRLWTRYEMGQRGPKWIAYVETLKAIDAKNYYGIDIGGHNDEDDLKVINWYDEEYNAILVDEKEHKTPTEHQVGFNPGIVIPCGAAPRISYKSGEYGVSDAYKDHGQSGFKDIENMLEPYNMIMSAYLTSAKRHRKPSVGVGSIDGNFLLSGSPYEEGSQVPLNKSKQQEIVELPIPELPKDAAIIAQEMGSKIQMAGPSFPFTGITGDKPWSGLSLNVAAHATLATIMPHMISIQTAIEATAWSVTRQFAALTEDSPNLDFKPIKLMFPVEKGMELHEFKPSEIKPYRFKCKLEIDMPRDEMEKWMQARIAHEGQDPLLSMQTISENILKVPDYDSERAKKLEELVMAIPTVMLRQVAYAFKERMDEGDPEALRSFLSVLYELEMMEQKQGNELRKALLEKLGLSQAAQGMAAPQPMQTPMQGMTPSAGMPMGGIEPGFTPPMAQSPGMMMNTSPRGSMNPATEQALRMRMAGLFPPSGG